MIYLGILIEKFHSFVGTIVWLYPEKIEEILIHNTQVRSKWNKKRKHPVYMQGSEYIYFPISCVCVQGWNGKTLIKSSQAVVSPEIDDCARRQTSMNYTRGSTSFLSVAFVLDRFSATFVIVGEFIGGCK